jgi:DNA-binding MarR family transcriptional regulator
MPTRTENLQDIYAISAITQRLMRSYMHSSGVDLHIAPSESQVLQLISEVQPVSLKELANAMHLTPGAITQLVDALVQAQYVTRTPSAQDRRMAVVALTPEGSRAISSLRRTKQDLFAKVVANLTDEELAAFLNVQRKMLEYLEVSCRNVKK